MGERAEGWVGDNLGPAPLGDDLPPASEAFALAFEHSPLGMSLSRIGADADGSPNRRSFMVNEAMARMLGHTVDELLSAPDQSRFTHPDDLAADAEHIAALVGGGGATTSWDKRYLHADGSVVWGRVSLALMRRPDGSPWFVISQIEDITMRVDLERHLRDLADRDDLSGLLNRRSFREIANVEIGRQRRHGGRSALLMIDLDHLKRLNDRHGHGVGDSALLAVADAIRDRIGRTDLAARIGGDEFVVLLVDAGLEDAQAVAESIRSTVSSTSVVEDGTVRLSASIGVALLHGADASLEAALEEADRAMYVVKEQRAS